jgi:hypothetical protein
MDEVKKKNPIPSLAGYGGVRSLQKKLERSTTLQQNREAVSYSLLCLANTNLTDIMEWDEQAVPANIQTSTVVIEEIESDNEEDNHNKAATAAQGNNTDSDKRGDKEQQEVCEAETKANKNDDEEKDDEEKDIVSQRKRSKTRITK